MPQRPAVLVLAGLDPSGGAGIQADIQTLTALGCHPLPIITCLTVQDTHNVHACIAVDPELIRRQLVAILADVDIAAIKSSALGSADNIAIMTELLGSLACPRVVDPILRAGGGGPLSDERLQDALCRQWIPGASLVTPNAPEALSLTGKNDAASAAQSLLSSGCGAVLVSGGHDAAPRLINRLFTRDQEYQWTLQRLPGEFHGSGCTLASAITAGLAQGKTLTDTIETAQAFVAHSLRHAMMIGRGQQIPDRINRENGQSRDTKI